MKHAAHLTGRIPQYSHSDAIDTAESWWTKTTESARAQL